MTDNKIYICGCCSKEIQEQQFNLRQKREIVNPENQYPSGVQVKNYWQYIAPSQRENFLSNNQFEDAIFWGTKWNNLPNNTLNYTINMGGLTSYQDPNYNINVNFIDVPNLYTSVVTAVQTMMEDLSKAINLDVEYKPTAVNDCFISINFLQNQSYRFIGIAMPPVNENDINYNEESQYTNLTDSFYASGNTYMVWDKFIGSASIEDQFQKGGYMYAVMIHELGHSLGLAHPHDNGGDSSIMVGVTRSRGSYGVYDANIQPITVMSYNDSNSTPFIEDTVNSTGTSGYMATFGPLDINLLQTMYGARTSNNIGDTVYTFPNSTTNQYWTCIYDTGGINTIDASAANDPQGTTININNSTLENETQYAGVSFSSDQYGGFTIAKTSSKILNVIGSSNNDNITGNDENNEFNLNAGGNDDVDGQDGIDTVLLTNLSFSDVTYQVNSNTGVITITNNNNGDVINLTNIEKIIFSDKTITITDNILESGFVQLDNNPKTITLNKTFENPIVCCGDPSFNGGDPCVVRITNITNNSFTMYLQEPPGNDGTHILEKVSWIVGEKGTWSIPDTDKLIIFDTYNSNLTTKNGFNTINFSQSFINNPVIVSQVATRNGPDFVVTRTRNINTNSFECSMQEAECLDNNHTTERIDWCAISSGNYTFNGRKFSCGSISNVTHNPKTYTFTDGYFDSMPQLLTRCSTFNGSDPCNTRNEQPVQFTVRLQEDTCKDPETNHVNENVDFIAIEDA
jgi:predicted Zn-dependent protease